VPQSFYRFLCFLFLILATIGFWAELSGQKIGFGISHFDKLAHFGIFFLLTALFWKAFKFSLWKIAAILALYGAFVEIVQEYLTKRTGDIWDWLADMAGVLAFILLRKLWHRWRPRSKS
jgi:VanZ family protein